MGGSQWAPNGLEAVRLQCSSARMKSPAWWLALVSLGMSIFFLCVQYPLMHRLYHRDVEDLLSKAQTKRLIERTIASVQEELRCKVDFEQMRLQDRPISIDVIVPYTTTGKTIASPIDVRAEITKELLEEFAVFGEMRPLQLKVVCTDSTTSPDLTSLVLSSSTVILLPSLSPRIMPPSSLVSVPLDALTLPRTKASLVGSVSTI